MILDDRKKGILRVIVEDYVTSAEPVGSRTIEKKYNLGLSSATIRNEMSDLEEMGYLEQPHTSAGRIPSDKGYRFYVNELMVLNQNFDEQIVKQVLDVKVNQLNDIVRQASNLLSQITNYTSVAISQKVNRGILEELKLIQVGYGKLLVVFIANNGTVKDYVMNINYVLEESVIGRINNVLNEKLKGLPLDKIEGNIVQLIKNEIDDYVNIIEPIFKGLEKELYQDDNQYFLDGTTNILNYPEFSNIKKAKEFLDLLEMKEFLNEIVKESTDNEINVLIGSENPNNIVKDVSIVTCTFDLNFGDVVTFGIIGPTRMDYAKVISSLKLVKERINDQVKIWLI